MKKSAIPLSNIVTLAQTGQLSVAEAQAVRLLRKSPANDEGWFVLGVIRVQMGRLSEAKEAFTKVLKLSPGHLGAELNIGNIDISFGDYKSAGAHFNSILRKDPDKLGALIGASYVAFKRNDLEQAMSLCQRAEKVGGEALEVLNTKAIIVDALGREAEAEELYKKILMVNASFPPALLNYAKILVSRGEPKAAKALLGGGLDPSYEPFESNLTLGRIHAELDEFVQAFERYEKCFSLDNENPELYYSLCDLYSKQFDNVNAHIAAKELRKYSGENLLLRSGIILNSFLRVSDFDEYDDLVRSVRSAHLEKKAFLNPLQSCTIFDDPESHLECAVKAVEKYVFDTHIQWKPKFPLRIGYLSGDFREHAVGYLTAGLFENHDRNRFEVFGFSNCDAEDTNLYRRISGSFDKFYEVKKLSDEELAQHIRDSQIDILIELSGHTSGSRLGAIARRCAPIQVSYLGHPGTTALSTIDYLIADRHVVTDENRPFFTEKIVFLPGSYQINDDRRSVDELRSEDVIERTKEEVIFCSFNGPHKYNPATFDAWAEILKKVERSRLWILTPNETFRQNLFKEFNGRGISDDRILCEKNIPNRFHLARISQADLFLDSFPYNAHTTASDALWAGVPVVTRAGKAFQSRVACSLLKTSALPELVSESWTDYVHIATRMATDQHFSASVRQKMLKIRGSPLFDTSANVRALERAYEEMAKLKSSGSEPRDIYI